MLSLSFTGILGNTPDPGVPDSGSYPTQNLTPVPYAIQALNATTATTEIYTLSLHDALPIYIETIHMSKGNRLEGASK